MCAAGSDFGLSIADRAVGEQRGAIWAESAARNRFLATLPLKK